MKKYEKGIIILLLLIGGYFIGKTIYNKSIQKQESIIAEQQALIDSLINQNQTLQFEKELVMYDLELLSDHYCASENLLDTIFVNFVTKGIFVFEYEPYSDIVNRIFENEELYELLEEKRTQL